MENQQVYPSINQSPRIQRGQAQSNMAPQGQPVAPKIVYMPVYTQNAQQPQVYPAQMQVPQPMPATSADSLEACHEKVDKVAKRVKCSSFTLMILGFIGVGFSALQCYRARHTAYRVIQGKRPFGPPGDESGPPDWDDMEAMEAFDKKEAEAGSQLMTRDELAVYDIMKTASFFLFLLSMLTILLGRCGMRTVWRQKSQCSYRVSKKSLIIIGMIFVFGLVTKNEAHDLHKIVKRYRHKKIQGNDTVSLVNQTESLNLTTARQLRDESSEYVDRQQDDAQFKKWMDMMQHKNEFSDDEDVCNAYDEDGCHSDNTCSWCKCAAVPSSCHSIEQAKKLPSAVFACDNLSQEEESFKNEGPWGYTGSMNGAKHHGHPSHDGKPPCKGHIMMQRAQLGFVFVLFLHMFNHYTLFKSLKALETKRVENGEVLSDDNSGCPFDKPKGWKKKFNRNVNNSGSSSENASQMH